MLDNMLMQSPACGLRGALLLLAAALSLPGCHPPQDTSTQPSQSPAQESSIPLRDTSKMRVGFSISFVKPSSFRAAMVNSFTKTARSAQAEGLIGDFKVLDADKNIQTQIEQVESLINEDYDAIIVLSGSATALNPTVKAACDAGIIVVDFDSEVTEPCSYTVATLWEQYGAVQGNYLGKRLEKGNLLEIRGAQGTTSDADISAAIHASLASFPQLKVVAAVQGDWTQAIAQEAVAEVLPSLPDIAAVVTQGGDGYGTALAFAASKRPLPMIMMGNRYEELKWWREQRDANGYQTISAATTPGTSSVSFWVAQQILAGHTAVPKLIGMPVLVIDDGNLDQWFAVTPVGGVANPEYTQEWTVQLIKAQNTDAPLPLPPLPDGL